MTPHQHYRKARATLVAELQRKREAHRHARPVRRLQLEREIAEVEAAIAATDALWSLLPVEVRAGGDGVRHLP